MLNLHLSFHVNHYLIIPISQLITIMLQSASNVQNIIISPYNPNVSLDHHYGAKCRKHIFAFPPETIEVILFYLIPLSPSSLRSTFRQLLFLHHISILHNVA